MMSVSVAEILKNRCQTWQRSRWRQTLAELPFTGDHVVCLSRDQAARSAPVAIAWARPGGLVMNQSEFEADLRREGYQIFYGGLQAGIVNPDHSHDWDARVMVIGGEITLIRSGKAETFRAGDSCTVAAGEGHAEHVGTQGVAYIAGRRNPLD